MKKEINKVLVIGSGQIIIGQAAEFELKEVLLWIS